MKKLASILVLFGLILAACGGNSPTAATVDGTVITVDDVDSLIASDEALRGHWRMFGRRGPSQFRVPLLFC